MAQMVLLNAQAFMGGYDLTGDMNAVAIQAAAEPVDNTTFGSAGTRSRVPGLKTVTAQIEGMVNPLANALGSDDAFFNSWGSADLPLIVKPDDTLNGIAYAFRSTEAAYSPGGAVGEMLRYSATLECSSKPGLIRGISPGKIAAAASGNSTPYLLGAVSATQRLYAALAVLGVVGTAPTLNVKVQSDDAVGFASPTDRVTFTQATIPSWQWIELPGAVTDTYWRISWTLGGTGGPAVTFATFLGIL